MANDGRANPRRRIGFTLIEVLVVVAIIALLISILLPSLSRARAQARNAQCMSNLHQLGVGAQEYAVHNNGVVRGETSGIYNGVSQTYETQWASLVAAEFNVKVKNPLDLPVDRLEMFHCPEREIGQAAPFLDYVANGLSPDGPNSSGVWSKKNSWIRVDKYKRASDVVYLCDAESEARVYHPASTFPTVKEARENWYAQPRTTPSIDAMDVFDGRQLPEGKNGFNTSDDAGCRRAARKLHVQRYTNASFLDGHASGLTLAGRATDEDNYGVWLARFGVTHPEIAKTLPLN